MIEGEHGDSKVPNVIQNVEVESEEDWREIR